MAIFTFAENAGVRIGSSPISSVLRGSRSDLESYSPATWLDSNSSPIKGGWWNAAKYEAIAAHPIVRRALLKHADAEATIGLKVYNRKTREPFNGPFADLMAWPSPIGPHRMRHWIALTRRKYGVAYLVLMRDGNGVVVEMLPASPLVMHWSAEKQRWVFTASSGDTFEFVRNDVWVVPNYIDNSGSLLSGVSSLDILKTMVDADSAIAESVHGWWKRGARPGMVLRHPGQLGSQAKLNLESSWSTKHEGASNAGRSVILEEGMDVTVLPFNAEAAQLSDTRAMLWEEACVALDVPPALIHLHERSTFNNVTELLKSWYRDIVSPQLRYLEDDYHRLALDQFGAPSARALVEHDVDSILWGAPIDRVEALAKADHLTVAEKRRIDNLPAIEGTDRILVNGAMVPLDKIDAWVDGRGQAASSSSPGTPETPPQKSVWRREDIDGVLAAVSRKTSLEEIDMDTLTSGLPGSCASDLGVIAALSGNVKQFRSHLKALEGR